MKTELYLTKVDICALGDRINLHLFNDDRFNAEQSICRLYGYWRDFLNGRIDCEDHDQLNRVLTDQLGDYRDKFKAHDRVFASIDGSWELV